MVSLMTAKLRYWVGVLALISMLFANSPAITQGLSNLYQFWTFD